jgi:hypothetical protein
MDRWNRFVDALWYDFAPAILMVAVAVIMFFG